MPTSGETGRPDGAPETLRALSERLDLASAQARRLASEAAEAVLRGGPVPPPSGWAVPGAEDGATAGVGAQFEGLVAVLKSMREFVPPDLQQRLAEAVRELLLAVRALLDWYIERLDRPQATASEAQDIPIL